MSIITVMQTPADAAKPHEKKNETRGISKKHTRRHTLPNLFVSLPLVPFFIIFFLCLLCCFFSPFLASLAQRTTPFSSLLSFELVYVRVSFISMRCLSPFASKEQYTKDISNLMMIFFFLFNVSFLSHYIKRPNK